nr:alpha/beta hydrolase [Rhodanobacter sp. MP7CTX1]
MSSAGRIVTGAPTPFWLGSPGRRLFATWYASPSAPRATVVICPPFFHEQFLSSRLFSLVAARLAQAGIACLRVDYYGTGDSEGNEAEFSIHGAREDIAVAVAAARARSGNAPTALLAVRGGGWPAWLFAAADSSISQLWIWQPILSGSSYLAELHRLDEAERALRADYPFCRQLGSYREDGQLVGYACPDALHSEIMAAKFPSQPLSGNTILGVLADDRIGEIPGHTTQRIELPESRTHWKDTLEVRATFLTRDLHEPIDRLTAILGTPRAVA